MSSTGQIVGGVIGTVVGMWAGYPMLGAQLGILAGGLADPPKGPTTVGPRLSDLTIQTSTYGAVIPRVYGTDAFSGNVFWLEGNAIKETMVKKKSGGKGGGSKSTSKTWVNTATFAVGLCQGPIAGIRRIWIKGELFYDAGSSDPSTIAASNLVAEGFQVYLGTDTQAPDPRIQADVGAANCPAWRGLAYLVFYDLPLAKYGDALMGAQVKVEVFKTGTVADYPYTYRSMPTWRNYWCSAWSGSIFCALVINTNICATSPDGITWTEHTLPVTTTWFGIGYGDGIFVALIAGSDRCYTSPDGVTWTERVLPASHTCYAVAWNGSRFVIANSSSQFWVSSDGASWAGVSHFGGSTDWSNIVWNPTLGLFASASQMGSVVLTSPDGLIWTPHSTGISSGNWSHIACKDARFLVTSSASAGVLYSDDGSTWINSNIAGTPTGVNSLVADNANFVAFDNASFYTAPDGINWSAHSMPGDYWTAASWNGSVIIALDYTHTFHQAVTIIPRLVAPEVDTLDNVVSEECIRSGLLTAGDIDVADLTSTVRGYLVASTGTIRSALEPLQAAWPFDVVQRGYKIKFLPRGGSSVVTIDADDLDARSASGKPGVQITTSREMDSQLPRVLTIKHVDYDREYEAGEQYVERLNTDAINDVKMELPIVLTAGEAVGKAETLLYLRWLERFDVSFSIPGTYNQLEPGDVVTLETPETNISLRLVAINYTSDGRLECRAKYNDPAIYTPAALASSPIVTGPSTLPLLGPTTPIFLDVPYMHPAQADPSFLMAMYGAADTWPGAVLVRTDDYGSTWAEIQGFSSPGAAIGSASNTIGDVDSRVWDKGSVLSVTMLNGELFDATEIAVLNGGNHFAYGAPGRWEIIGVQKCTLISADNYKLSDMLRGRKGTEWAMSLHAVGDKVVALSETDVTTIGMSSSAIGLERTYRAVTLDMEVEGAADQLFTYQGVNLECLSPVYFTGARTIATGDWEFSWVRRSRTDGEWRDLVDVGLGESTEAYELDIFTDNTYTTVKRTITASTPTCTYTAAQQVADFGYTLSSVSVKVYQMSSIVGRGYPLAAYTFVGPLGYGFTQTQNITYLELLPPNLQTLNETFPADSGFTKYTEGTPGTTAVASSKYTITHVTGTARNDIVVKNTVSFSMPLVWVECSISVTNTGATGYDNGGVGIVKDANNFLFASMDRLANTVRLQIKIGGTNTFIGTIAQTWGTTFKLGLSLVANSACVWIDVGAGWVYKLGADVTSYYDFRTTGNLTGWNPGFTLANGGGNSTWDFSALKAGSFGGVGMRDQTLVTDDTGRAYFPATDTIQFSATIPDPRGTAYCGVFTMDLLTNTLTQTAAIMVSRSGKTYNDLSAHIIRYSGGNRRMLISTWGNGFSGSIQTLHELFTSGDVLVGANVVTMTAITLPGQTGALPGAYDAMMAWDGSKWVITYTLTDDTSFAGNPFYPAVATSTAMSSFTLVDKDSTHTGYEGTKLINDNGEIYVMAGGPAGSGTKARVYDSSLHYMGDLNITLSGGADTQPHPMMFQHAGKRKIISFDNTRYGGVGFTWGHVRIYEAL